MGGKEGFVSSQLFEMETKEKEKVFCPRVYEIPDKLTKGETDKGIC